jgi:hypothetical protein
MIEGSTRPFGTAVGHVGRKYANGTVIEDQDDAKVPYELHYKSVIDHSVENMENKL